MGHAGVSVSDGTRLVDRDGVRVMDRVGVILVVDPRSPVAPYEQLRVQVIDAVRSGSLAAGAKLPTVRRLADDLGIAPNTVARSYRELERDGMIETRGRNGSFVSASGDAATQQAQLAARAFAERIRELRMPVADALDLVRAALDPA